jgi:hypothetical protein
MFRAAPHKVRVRADAFGGSFSNVVETPEVHVSLERLVNVSAESGGKNGLGELILLMDLERLAVGQPGHNLSQIRRLLGLLEDVIELDRELVRVGGGRGRGGGHGGMMDGRCNFWRRFDTL